MLKKINGFSLVELIVAIGVFSVLAGGVTYVVTNSYNNFYGVGDKQKITEFAQEGLEIARKIKDDSWTYFTANAGANKGVAKNINGAWEFSGSSNISGDLTRVIYIANVSRDAESNIVESGGTDDLMTKKVTVTVSGTGITDYVLSTYLTNWGDKSWAQTDWSGGLATEYWSSANKAYSSSSIDGISTAGALILSPGTSGGTTWDWQDLMDMASSTGNGTAYATAVDEHHWYWCGSSTTFWRFDITNIRTTGFPTREALSTATCRNIVINPVYPHVYTSHNNGVVRTISTSSYSVLQTFTPATATGFSYAGAINAAGTEMYIGGAGGYLFSFSINTTNGTLTCQNCNGSGAPQTFSGDVIGTMWLDDANDMLYIGTDSATNAMMKINVSNPAVLASAGYVYGNTVDFTDISYVGTNDLGQNRFVVGTDYSASLAEFYVIDDTGSAFSKVAQVDLSAVAGTTINVKDIFYTGNNEAFVMANDASTPYSQLFTISGVTSAATPTVASDLRSANFYGFSTLSYHPTAYSPTYGGIFIGWTYGGSSTARSTFIEQTSVSIPPGYASSGNLVSSKFDLGSADKDLHTLTVNQSVPSGCSVTITFSADNDSAFGSATTQAFTSSADNYTASFNADMSGQRWLRYQVDLVSCSSDTETPTLYDLKVNYR